MQKITNCNNNLIIELITTDLILCSFLIVKCTLISLSLINALCSSAHKVLIVGLNQFNSLSITEFRSIAQS